MRVLLKSTNPLKVRLLIFNRKKFMKSEITGTKPRTILHKKNHKEKNPTKEVLIWRGLDIKTYKYILTNKYYPDILLIQNGLDYIVALKQQRNSPVAPA